MAPEEREVRAKRAPKGTETILLVEDDEMVRTLVRETLGARGLQGARIGRPDGGAAHVAENFRGKIQLLITDVVMPKSAARNWRADLTAERPDMKVLYMSGYTDSAIVNSGILHKEVSFLQKPFTPAGSTQQSARGP